MTNVKPRPSNDVITRHVHLRARSRTRDVTQRREEAKCPQWKVRRLGGILILLHITTKYILVILAETSTSTNTLLGE